MRRGGQACGGRRLRGEAWLANIGKNLKSLTQIGNRPLNQ